MKFRRPVVENKGWAWWLASALALCLLVAVVTYWASIWLAPPVRIAPAGTLSDSSGPTNLAPARSLFGQLPPAAAARDAAPVSSNIRVLGILAAGPRGSALLSVDGRPGKAHAVGDLVDGKLRVLAIDAREVRLGDDQGGLRQSLPAPARADLAVLTRGPAPAAGNPTGAPGSTPAGPASVVPTAPPGPNTGTVPPAAAFSPSPSTSITPATSPGSPAPQAGLPQPAMASPGMPPAPAPGAPSFPSPAAGPGTPGYNGP